MTLAYDAPAVRSDSEPFVSRSAEVDRLDAVLERLADGGPSVVDITGEAGIGKSRLLTEFGVLAWRRGMTVLRGQATEYERHSPFQPFADAFAWVGRRDLEAVPELRELPAMLRGGFEEASSGRWTGDRFGLYQETAAALGRIRGTGLVVLLDDLHWADAASLELLDHLIRHPLRAPVLLVVARRDRQSPTLLDAASARGVDTGTVLRLALGPLGERDCVEELARDLPPRRAAEIYAASEGNPLYFLTLLQAERGARLPRMHSPPLSAPAGSPTESTAGSPAGNGPRTGLEALLLDELSSLEPLERRILDATAVLGDHATPDLLGAITGVPVSEVVEALHEVMKRDLMRPDHGRRRLVLRHPVVRALVHDSIAPWQREQLHRQAAAELARAGATLLEQAHHIEQSLNGWDPQAAALLTEAAEETAMTAPATSAHWSGAVLRILPDTPQHLGTRRELMLLRARTLGVTGALRESRDLLHEVIDLPDGEPGPDDDGVAVRTSAVAQCALMERYLGRYQEAEALLRRELARTPGTSPSQQVELGSEVVSCALFGSRFAGAREELARTVAVAGDLGDPVAEAGVLALAAMCEAYEGNVDAALKYAESAALITDLLTGDDLSGLGEPLARLGWSELFLERFAEAERHADRGLEAARRTGQLHMLPHLLLCKAYAHLNTCRIATALEFAEEAVDVARALGSGELTGFALAIRALVLMQAGNRTALATAEEAVEAVGAGDSWWATVSRSVLAQVVLTVTGDPYRAWDLMLRAGDGKDLARLQPSLRPTLVEVVVNAALATGRMSEAEFYAERAAKEAEQLGLPVQRGAALRCLAQLDAHRGDPAAAAQKYVRAAQVSARSGATLREAQSLLLGAPHVKAAGVPHQAADMWRRGRRLAQEGGAQLLVGLADMLRPAVLDTANGRAAGPGLAETPVPVPGLAALTARQREIAGLVGEGLSTRGIASRLHLSTRTVESHIAAAYRKTGATSRAALASLMARERARGE
ncbi:helix-turn-helix transcriptional regulator [Streptomyces sp. CA-288835]|uniref:helix-turn-helix transcriptional regulator n=1 Tax=Streptomyces sp. CA-288835 TaxID=3240069 RepID=UPI003D8B88D9